MTRPRAPAPAPPLTHVPALAADDPSKDSSQETLVTTIQSIKLLTATQET